MSQESGTPKVEEAVRDRLTLRAFLIGLTLCVFLGLAIPYNRMVIQGSFLSAYFLDRGGLFLFFGLVLIINPLLIALIRRFALTRGELLSIYVMLLLVQSLWWIVKALIPFLTGVTYFASPETPHLEAVLPHILPWLVPQGTEVVRGLYEGLPEGAPLPWGAWVASMWSWGTFLMALFIVLICLAVMMRKQWEEHERFVFPLMQVPLEMGVTGEGKVGPLFKNRLMWAGFAIPFLVGTLRGLHAYYPFAPTIDLGTTFWIFRRSVYFPLVLSFALFGYSYFINLDISLSIWLFNVLSKVIRGVLALIGAERGYNVSGVVGPYSSGGSAFLALMGIGYMLVLAAYSLWVARGHLRDVWARALGRPSKLGDSEEVIPYRQAMLGFAGGLLYMGCWLYWAGISPLLILFFLFTCLVVFFVLARVVSETGFVVTYSPMDPPSEFVVCAVGSSAFSPAGLVTFGFSYAWTMGRLNTLMPHAQGALRLASEIEQKRGLSWAMGAALVAGLISTSYIVLKMGYTHGGLNLDFYYNSHARLPFDVFVGRRMLSPSPIFLKGFLYAGLGAGLTAFLIVMRTRLAWWPLHPVALPLSTIWYTDAYVFSVFLAWGIKALVLKFGGAGLYRTTRPFFIGIILGEVVSAGVWVVVDYFTGMTGNMVYF